MPSIAKKAALLAFAPHAIECCISLAPPCLHPPGLRIDTVIAARPGPQLMALPVSLTLLLHSVLCLAQGMHALRPPAWSLLAQPAWHARTASCPSCKVLGPCTWTASTPPPSNQSQHRSQAAPLTAPTSPGPTKLGPRARGRPDTPQPISPAPVRPEEPSGPAPLGHAMTQHAS